MDQGVAGVASAVAAASAAAEEMGTVYGPSAELKIRSSSTLTVGTSDGGTRARPRCGVRSYEQPMHLFGGQRVRKTTLLVSSPVNSVRGPAKTFWVPARPSRHSASSS